MKNQDLTSLLIQWDQCNKKIEKIKNDPEYIKKETRRVFGEGRGLSQDQKRQLNTILNSYL